jgi:hypothetical protein
VCAHFTPENTTACTRVSLDFRVVPEAVWAAGHDRFSGEEGYYVRAERGEGDGAPWVPDSAELVTPDWRTGFPFTDK